MIAFISDVHGNLPALQAVLEKIDDIGCNTIISLGDVAGYYCFLNECIELLRQRNIVHLMGNHDYYLVNNTRCPRSNTVNELLALQSSLITADNLNWLSKSPYIYETREISCVHGGWLNYLDEYMHSVTAEYFTLKKQKAFFSGHTHIPFYINFGDYFYCNPGSVGQPRDKNPCASFVVYQNDAINYRVNYDIDMIAMAMCRFGFSDYYYKGLYHGLPIGYIY